MSAMTRRLDDTYMRPVVSVGYVQKAARYSAGSCSPFLSILERGRLDIFGGGGFAE